MQKLVLYKNSWGDGSYCKNSFADIKSLVPQGPKFEGPSLSGDDVCKMNGLLPSATKLNNPNPSKVVKHASVNLLLV